jgi:hypothetical protein
LQFDEVGCLITFSCFSDDLYHHSVMFSSVQEINVLKNKKVIEDIVQSPFIMLQQHGDASCIAV